MRTLQADWTQTRILVDADIAVAVQVDCFNAAAQTGTTGRQLNPGLFENCISLSLGYIYGILQTRDAVNLIRRKRFISHHCQTGSSQIAATSLVNFAVEFFGIKELWLSFWE